MVDLGMLDSTPRDSGFYIVLAEREKTATRQKRILAIVAESQDMVARLERADRGVRQAAGRRQFRDLPIPQESAKFVC